MDANTEEAMKKLFLHPAGGLLLEFVLALFIAVSWVIIAGRFDEPTANTGLLVATLVVLPLEFLRQFKLTERLFPGSNHSVFGGKKRGKAHQEILPGEEAKAYH